jgi:Fe-S-cluster-containing hydrogenase component 2
MKNDFNSPRSEPVAKPSSRRGFLGVAAAGMAGILLAPGVRLIEIAQAAPVTGGTGASSKVRWGMLIDSGKCASGCTDCVTACNTENGLSGGKLPTDSQWIRKIEIKEVRTGKTQSLPMMCQHCAEPPCVDVCPTGASFKRADGIVLVDKHICIGCRYCVMACARAPEQPEDRRAARHGYGRRLHDVCAQGRQGGATGLRHGLLRRRSWRHSVW